MHDRNCILSRSKSSFATASSFKGSNKFFSNILAPSDLPIQAVKLVEEQNLQFAFGDFDDHLEDVTIDWLRNKACLP